MTNPDHWPFVDNATMTQTRDKLHRLVKESRALCQSAADILAKVSAAHDPHLSHRVSHLLLHQEPPTEP